MLTLVMLVCVCIYCWYNYNTHQRDIYLISGGFAGVITLALLTAAYAGTLESSFEFEAQKEVRKNIEYQIENPHRRDYNFFEQLSEYNSNIVKQQNYNKDWFLNSICVSDKWDTIEPLTFSEAN